MNIEIASKIAQMLGEVTLSELPLADDSNASEELLFYEKGSASAAPDVFSRNFKDFMRYVCKHVYAFLVYEDTDGTFKVFPELIGKGNIPDGHPCKNLVNSIVANVRTEGTENWQAMALGDVLKSKLPSWIGDYKGITIGTSNNKNITDVWFRHFQYRYLDNMGSSLRTMLVRYGTQGKTITNSSQLQLWPSRWNTNIDLTVEGNNAHVQFPKVAELSKALYIPETAIDEKNAFKHRDYMKIVPGGFLNNANKTWPDKKWLDASGNVEINEDLDGQTNIGDITQTLKSLSDFMDDYMDVINPTCHVGKVMFTSSSTPPTSVATFGDSSKVSIFTNVLSLNAGNLKQAMVWCSGDGQDIACGDTMALPTTGVPKHNHKTLPGEAIHNVSIIGKPEGESVGGIAKVDTAEYLGEKTKIPGMMVISDTNQPISSSSAILSSSGKGPYTGSVMYDGYQVGATSKPHANVPPYYRVRAYVCTSTPKKD